LSRLATRLIVLPSTTITSRPWSEGGSGNPAALG
jgi:hypothetical protein